MINIVNYRVGNLQNIQNAFSTLGFSSQIINNPEELKIAEKIVLPGVGSFLARARFVWVLPCFNGGF